MDANKYRGGLSQCECFNPRARDGREKADDHVKSLEKVSIHAPVMDANKHGAVGITIARFQSTRP